MPTDLAKRSWTPLLEGADAALAESALDGIAAALDREEVLSAIPMNLSRGVAGLALFYGYLALARPGKGWKETTEKLLGLAVERLGQEAPFYGFHAGYTGAGWVVDHLQQRLFGGEQDFNEAIDEAALDFILRGPRPAHVDFQAGAAGSGVYGLGRLRKGLGRRIVAAALQCLEEEARSRDGGLAWLTPPMFIRSVVRAEHPNGWYDLGAAEGVPGIIGFLGLACEAGVEEARARRLMEGAVDWFLGQRSRDAEGPRFARAVTVEGQRLPAASRLGWRHGELGAAVALLGAARRAGRPDWEAEALGIARETARLEVPDEPHLYEGGMGAAQLFHSLHQASGEALFAEAARRCYGAALKPWREGVPLPFSDEGWGPGAGFLLGAAGLGLGLLAGLSPVEPAWQRLMMADIPEKEAQR